MTHCERTHCHEKVRQDHFTEVNIADGSTLDALLRQVGLLRDAETNPLAGQMTAPLDIASRLPRHIWYEPDAQAHDQRFWPHILAALKAGGLLIFDLGYTHFAVFAQLTAANVTFIACISGPAISRCSGMMITAVTPSTG